MPDLPGDHASDADPSASRVTAFETVLLAGGLALFLGLFYVMRDFLNPPLVAVALAMLLWPLRRRRPVRAMMISGGFLLLLWFLDKLSLVLLPFALVYLLAYLFDPLVEYLDRRVKMPRWTSSMLVTALIVGILALVVLLIVPKIFGEVRVLATRLLDAVGGLHDWITHSAWLDELEATGLIDKEQAITQISAIAQEQTVRLTSSLPNAVQGIFRSIGSLLALITIIGVVPVMLYYTLKDYPHISKRLVELFPTFGGRRDYLVEASRIVGNYLRGQLTISAIAAFNVSVALTIFDVPFGLLIGLLAGLLNMIPNLGAMITNIIGITIALIFGDPWYLDALIVFLVLMGQGLLEQSILTPNILSHHVGLHPVLILLSLFVFGAFLGIFGLLIAVPATALLMTVYKAYRDEWTLDLAAYQKPTRSFMRWQRARQAGAKTTSSTETPPPSETHKAP